MIAISTNRASPHCLHARSPCRIGYLSASCLSTRITRCNSLLRHQQHYQQQQQRNSSNRIQRCKRLRVVGFVSSAWHAASEPSSVHDTKLSNEFRRACDAQLRQLQTALRGCHGSHERIGSFSVFVRVPSSLEAGDLSLQRVACRANSDYSAGYSAHAEADALVELRQDGTPDARHVIEDWLNQQSSFELPGDLESTVFPLTFMPQQQAWEQQQTADCSGERGTLLGLLVVEGTDVQSRTPTGDTADADDEVIQQPPIALAPAVNSEVSATAAAAASAPSLPSQRVAGLLLEQACESLVMTCALELRLYLERASLVAAQQRARHLVDEARKPLSVLRTFGSMLQLRAPKGQLEGDMADGIMVQGDQLHAVLTQLAQALHPYPLTTTTQQMISDRQHKSNGGSGAG